LPDGKTCAIPTNADDIIHRCMLDSMPAELVEMGSVEEVGNEKLFRAFLLRVAETNSSIELTFHGTPAKNVEKIITQGLRPSDSGLFGAGVYVGAHAGKAHNYTRPDVSGWRHMFCVIVDVGQAVINLNAAKGNVRETSTDSLDNPTEYCFFERDRLFISHLITYRTLEVPGGEKEAKRKFKAELLRAVERSRDRTQPAQNGESPKIKRT